MNLFLLLPAASAQALPETPLLPGPVLAGAWPGADFGAVLAAAGDVDLNGKPDLLVGAPLYDGEGVDRGRVVLYLADRDNQGYLGASWTMEGATDRGQYGGALAGGHDVDGDGFDDIALGSAYQGWRVDLYTGGAAGPSAAADWSVDRGGGRFGHALALLGDTDGDGYAELAIGDRAGGEHGEVHLYAGSAEGPLEAMVLAGQEGHAVGAVVAAAGDVDGDGLADLLSGAGSEDPLALSASLWLGATGGLSSSADSHLSPPAGAAGFGVSGAGGGDVDGDGLDDLVLGDDGIGAEGSGRGQVLGWSGGGGGLPAWQVQDSVDDTLLGRAVAVVGDVDGDGHADVLAGRPGFEVDQSLEGGAALYMGSALGLTAAHAWQGEGDLDADAHGGVWIGYGQAVVGLGDIDGDEHADVAVGAPNTGADSYELRLGEVRIYTGTAWQAPEVPADTGGDTAAPAGDTGQEPGGCGCQGLPGPAALPLLSILLPALLGLLRRRR